MDYAVRYSTMEIPKSIEDFRREIMEELGSAVAAALTDRSLSVLLDQEIDTAQLLERMEQGELYRAGLPVGAVRKLMEGLPSLPSDFSSTSVSLMAISPKQAGRAKKPHAAS